MQPYMCDYCGKRMKQEDDYGIKVGYIFPIHKKCFLIRFPDRKGTDLYDK